MFLVGDHPFSRDKSPAGRGSHQTPAARGWRAEGVRFDSVQSPAEPHTHNHGCLVAVSDPTMFFLTSSPPLPGPGHLTPPPFLRQLGTVPLFEWHFSEPQRRPWQSASCWLLSSRGGLAALKGVGYLPQAPADALEPLSKAMSGSALHSNP